MEIFTDPLRCKHCHEAVPCECICAALDRIDELLEEANKETLRCKD